jgi:hypothetical protein
LYTFSFIFQDNFRDLLLIKETYFGIVLNLQKNLHRYIENSPHPASPVLPGHNGGRGTTLGTVLISGLLQTGLHVLAFGWPLSVPELNPGTSSQCTLAF